jgi:hypothetical protein
MSIFITDRKYRIISLFLYTHYLEWVTRAIRDKKNIIHTDHKTHTYRHIFKTTFVEYRTILEMFHSSQQMTRQNCFRTSWISCKCIIYIPLLITFKWKIERKKRTCVSRLVRWYIIYVYIYMQMCRFVIYT